MPKSRWDSDFWKAVKALSVTLTIIVSILTILQWMGQVDVYNLLILPIVNFFTISIPLFSIPLTVLIVLVILFVLARTENSTPAITSNPLDDADILDNELVRAMAILCKTPQTTDSLRQEYHDILRRSGVLRAYSFEDSLKMLEDRKLLIFTIGKWHVTQKALDYIAKYNG